MRVLAIAVAACAPVAIGTASSAQTAAQGSSAGETGGGHGQEHDHDHDHAHGHSHGHAHDDAVYRGYFEDSAVQDRALRDWEGEWQSVYPYLVDGTLDPVMEEKARGDGQSAQAHRAYYERGYRTQTDGIEIEGETVRFLSDEGALSARYAYDDHEVLTYEKGNRGVRYVFEKIEGDDAAPRFIQFSDHQIAPRKSDHFHLYWGDDRAALLEEVSHWPTYYPASLTGDAILAEMMAH